MKKLIQFSIVLALLSASFATAYYEDFYNLYMNPQLSPIYGYKPLYGFSYSPYYDSSSNWHKGWAGSNYIPGLRYTPDGTEAAIYPPQYGSARYNPYTDDRNFEVYQQTRDYSRQYLQANEVYDDLNYPAKQLSYLDFFTRTDPRSYNFPFGYLYPYGKKPYFKQYGDPRPITTNLEGTNGFWGFTYARNFHCHGPNFGCHVHNTFEDSA
ncbi:MAG TPA: hypothetical protein VJG90_07375 [Candidatus Nanoarchaeia archaeon]|nr:hypothetical protein [Candidatus Nanoarchaeia archaeon]